MGWRSERVTMVSVFGVGAEVCIIRRHTQLFLGI